MLTRVAVVVPAHDEERLLPASLAAISRAARRVAPVPVDVFVVADTCTDSTVDIARAAGAHAVPVRARDVGFARAAGMAAALAEGSGWLATTDADCRVGADWLARQLRYAAAGYGVVVGTVRVEDWTGWSPALAPAYHEAYRARLRGRGHRHIHGANLGMSAAAYMAAGGFAAAALAEDVAFVTAARRAGLRIAYATDLPVVTSTRRHARARGGFSDYLRRLEADLARRTG